MKLWNLYLIKYKKSSSALILKDLRELLNTDIINIVSGQKNDLNFINGSDGETFQSNFRTLYDVYSTPQTYLLDKDKKILSKKMSIESLEKILEYFIEERDKSNEK